MPDTPSPGQDAQLDTLKMEYSEICKSYHNVRDMQLKLLTLIPIASGTAVSVVIKVPRDQVHTVMVGLVGFALMLGLFLYSSAESLYEAVAQGLAALRGREWVAEMTHGAVKVSVADVRVEHEVNMAEFTKWLDRPGGSPREMIQRQKVRSILGMPVMQR